MARFPHLAGQSAVYLKKQLKDFKQGRRTNDAGAMSGIAETLSDADVDTIVRHFASQVLRPRGGEAEGDVAVGRRLYLSGKPGVAACVSCHGTAAPVIAGAPRLSGQQGAYLAKQLADFRAGTRRNDAQGVMNAVAKALSPAEINALAAFLAAGPVMTGASR
jgi:cytochrome c553